MAFDTDLILFSQFFSGNPDAHGKYLPPPPNEIKTGEKIKGSNSTVREFVERSLYEKHLRGQVGLGIVPLNKTLVKFIAIDIDIYNDTHIKKIVDTVYKNKLPLLPFKSKSGGIHLYSFFRDFVVFTKIKDSIMELLPVLQAKKGTEVFPKQKKLKDTDFGNWINIPYFNYENTRQYLIAPDFSAIPFSEALAVIDKSRMTDDEFIFYVNELPLSDAPPCLQAIYFDGNIDHRNEYLFNMAVYLKAKVGDDFDVQLHEMNNMLLDPLDEKELNDTIIQSHKKRDYSYKCQTYPCANFCNKDLCKERKYGLGNEEVNDFSFEDLIQYNTDPPYYHWFINGKLLEFYSESDMLNQNKFQELCVRRLHKCPNRLKDTTWKRIINRALSHMTVKEIEPADDLSVSSMFKFNLYEFFENRVEADNLGQVLFGRVFKDKATNNYVFRINTLSDFLTQRNFKGLKVAEMRDKLSRMGAVSTRIYIDKNNKQARVWTLPFTALEELKIHIEGGLEIDFSNYERPSRNELY
jgi:hypothetical protein